MVNELNSLTMVLMNIWGNVGGLLSQKGRKIGQNAAILANFIDLKVSCRFLVSGGRNLSFSIWGEIIPQFGLFSMFRPQNYNA